MILALPPGDRSSLDPLDLFLPLALAGFVIVVLFSVQCLAELFADQDKGSK